MDRVIIISASYLNNTIFMGNAQLQSIRSRGFQPRRCDSPDTIKPERCYVIIAQRRGGMRGQALSPPSSYQHPEFHIKGKGIQQSHKIKKIHLSNQKYDGGTGIIQQKT
jgi:hypothetical protein